jgi:hypothetical protein
LHYLQRFALREHFGRILLTTKRFALWTPFAQSLQCYAADECCNSAAPP